MLEACVPQSLEEARLEDCVRNVLIAAFGSGGDDLVTEREARGRLRCADPSDRTEDPERLRHARDHAVNSQRNWIILEPGLDGKARYRLQPVHVSKIIVLGRHCAKVHPLKVFKPNRKHIFVCLDRNRISRGLMLEIEPQYPAHRPHPCEPG